MYFTTVKLISRLKLVTSTHCSYQARRLKDVRGSRAYLISITVQCLSIVLSRSCICTVYLKQICVAGPQNGLEM